MNRNNGSLFLNGLWRDDMDYWVLMRDDGKFVTTPGSEKSYTSYLQYARTYRTREKALKDCCIENEKPVKVSNILQVPVE